MGFDMVYRTAHVKKGMIKFDNLNEIGAWLKAMNCEIFPISGDWKATALTANIQRIQKHHREWETKNSNDNKRQ